MKIIVCIKQVPATSNVEIDSITGVLKREGVESKMNPYDLYALETAMRLKEKNGGNLTTITMGPPQAESVIKESFALGADEGYIFSDRKFAGSDVLATAFTLSQGIRLLGNFDLIICGKQTTDGDTAQIGPELAEFLEIPHVTWVKEIAEVTEKSIVVEQDLGNSSVVLELPLPALITVEKNIYQPRLPSYRRKMQTANQQVKKFTLLDFIDNDEQKYGLKGSATQVERIFPPTVCKDQIFWDDEVPIIAEKIYTLVKRKNFI
ncbi:electron transfer flavoprotein subunit beta/FixA family protein [Atribacter laminatus]|uniref:electron transfer flavoprotein subunit beta/FixA family protein n=1 Tax=Atribacter laminatus TaxID=2847778 RepID=UPI0031B57D99